MAIIKISFSIEKIQNIELHFSITYASASLIVFAEFTGKHSVGIIAHVGEGNLAREHFRKLLKML